MIIRTIRRSITLKARKTIVVGRQAAGSTACAAVLGAAGQRVSARQTGGEMGRRAGAATADFVCLFPLVQSCRLNHNINRRR